MSLADYNSERGITITELTASVVEEGHGEELDNKEPRTTRIELMDITEKDRPYGDRPLIIPTSSFNQAKDIDAKYREYALLLRRKINKDGDRLSTALEIWSPLVRAALREILVDCSYLNLAACPIVLPQPYHALFHYRKELRAFAESPKRTEEEKKHIAILITFMDKNLSRIEREFEQYEPNGQITFNLLWTLFRPETTIVLQTNHFSECYRVHSCVDTVLDGEIVFEISAWCWAYNGILFGPTQAKLHIKDFQGARNITDLNIYPLELLPQPKRKELVRDAISRGQKWRTLVDRGHRQYTGPAWVNPSLDAANSMNDLITVHVNGRIFLDYKSHLENNYGLSTVLYSQNGIIRPKEAAPDRRYHYFRRGSEDDDTRLTEDQMRALNDMKCYPNDAEYMMTDDQALLCPARIRGFALSEKHWAFFLLERITDIAWSEAAFDKLELDSSVKSKVQALVEIHYTKNNFDDLVAGKGRGLVVLLHGPPGTGKTLTAESIAEYTHRPLYYIGAGELGMDVGTTERQLQKIFNLAKSWGCVLLLDEADVFLAKRTRDDMLRNGFVSVFLRLLEYYEGIIFLTTNRIEEFDPAFQSRIHLRLAYSDLDAYKRTNIWRNLLRAVESCAGWGNELFEGLGKDLILNGREIKNLIRTALAISSHGGRTLEVADLKDVYQLNYASGNGMLGPSTFGPAVASKSEK